MHHVPLEFVQKKVTGGGHRSTNASLSLTSMIDFLVVTVVFLLMTFSASGETPVGQGRQPAQGREHARHDRRADRRGHRQPDPRRRHAGRQHARDRGLASACSASTSSSTSSRRKRELWKQTAPGQGLPGRRRPPDRPGRQAVVVKSVFQTAAFAGFPNVSFMVNNLPKSGH